MDTLETKALKVLVDILVLKELKVLLEHKVLKVLLGFSVLHLKVLRVI